jgi:hypothetical protein
MREVTRGSVGLDFIPGQPTSFLQPRAVLRRSDSRVIAPRWHLDCLRRTSASISGLPEINIDDTQVAQGRLMFDTQVGQGRLAVARSSKFPRKNPVRHVKPLEFQKLVLFNDRQASLRGSLCQRL